MKYENLYFDLNGTFGYGYLNLITVEIDYQTNNFADLLKIIS